MSNEQKTAHPVEGFRHTPGPWRIDARGGDHGSPIILAGDVPVVHMMHGDYDSEACWPITDADLALIAAAPDLLEACIALLRNPSLLALADYVEKGIGTATESGRALIMARAAIAKATTLTHDSAVQGNA
jgi:hypothetical protein